MSMEQNEVVVMYDSPEAATYRTGITGWVSRDGLYFGDGPKAEAAARYHSCTHRPCADCGAPAEKWRTLCGNCRRKSEDERYAKMPRKAWDGKSLLYSQTCDRYYDDISSAEDDLNEGQTLDELQLVICEPNYARQIDEDFFCDDMDTESALPSDIQDAMEDFNEAVAGTVLSWSPGKYALDLSDVVGG